MQVSIGTARRILGQEGNDRSVLEHAFTSVGLQWSDNLCEPLEALPEAPPESLDPAPRIATPPRRSRTGFRLAALLLLGGTLCGTVFFSALLGERDGRPSAASNSTAAIPYDARTSAKWIAEARVAYHRGDYDSAKRSVDEAIWQAQCDIDPNALAEAIRLDGEILAARGMLREAMSRFETALQLRTTFEAPWGRASLLIAMASVDVKLRRYALAESRLLEALGVMKEVGDQAGVAEACRDLGSIAAARGNFARARNWFEQARTSIADRPEEPMHLDIGARVALVAAAEGRPQEALRDLRRCLAQWEQLGYASWIARTRFQIGAVLWQLGDRPGALREVSTAQSGFAGIGNAHGVEECSQWLADRTPAGQSTRGG